jgi:hypothetical protein
VQESEGKRMTAAPKYGSLWKLQCFPAPERGDFSKNSGVFLQLSTAISTGYTNTYSRDFP